MIVPEPGVGTAQDFWFRRTGFRFLPLASRIFSFSKVLAGWTIIDFLRRLETPRELTILVSAGFIFINSIYRKTKLT